MQREEKNKTKQRKNSTPPKPGPVRGSSGEKVALKCPLSGRKARPFASQLLEPSNTEGSDS